MFTIIHSFICSFWGLNIYITFSVPQLYARELPHFIKSTDFRL